MTRDTRVECWLLCADGPTTRVLLVQQEDPAKLLRRPVAGTCRQAEDVRKACLRTVNGDTGIELQSELLVNIAGSVEITNRERGIAPATVFAAYIPPPPPTVDTRSWIWAPLEGVAGLLGDDAHRRTWELVVHALGLQVEDYFTSANRVPAEADIRALEKALDCTVLPLYSTPSYHNQHFVATCHGRRYFVKILPRRKRHYLAEVDASTCLSETVVNVPRLVSHGEISAHRCWVALEWRNIRPFSVSMQHIEEAGALLARMHRLTRGAEGLRVPVRGNIGEVIQTKADSLHASDPELAGRLVGLRERFASGEQALQTFEADSCLLHGNLGWRNLGVEHDGQLILFDFEHAAIGAPILDLAKLWDRELTNPEARSCFLAGYQREAPESALQNWHAAIDIVRLWAVAGMFTYTRKHTDPAFERHAWSILRQLAELP